MQDIRLEKILMLVKTQRRDAAADTRLEAAVCISSICINGAKIVIFRTFQVLAGCRDPGRSFALLCKLTLQQLPLAVTSEMLHEIVIWLAT